MRAIILTAASPHSNGSIIWSSFLCHPVPKPSTQLPGYLPGVLNPNTHGLRWGKPTEEMFWGIKISWKLTVSVLSTQGICILLKVLL